MIATFLSLQAIRIAGLLLSYAIIIFLNRSQGPAGLGKYLYLINTVIVTGTIAALGTPTLVQRLGAKLGYDQIGAGTRLILFRRLPVMSAVAVVGVVALLAQSYQPLSRLNVIALILSAFGFAVTLVLIETLRIAYGPHLSEVQRNLVRPALIFGLLIAGLDAVWAIPFGVLVTLALALALTSQTLRQDPIINPAIRAYVSERGRDLTTVFILGTVSLVFGAMDVLLFGLLEDPAETGIYGTGSRYGMLVNVALMAGNAQMMQNLAKVASQTDQEGRSLALLRAQVQMVRLSSSILLVALTAALPLYSWIVDLPAAQLWPYFAVVAISFWIQGMLGPVNIFLVQAHEVGRLIHYHMWGILVFGIVSGALFLTNTNLAIPIGAAAGTNTVKLLSWWRIHHSRNLSI